MAIIKKKKDTKITSAGENMEKRNRRTLSVGCKLVQSLWENEVAQKTQK